MKKLIITALAIVTMVGCTKEYLDTTPSSGGAVQFSTNNQVSRVESSSSTSLWEKYDNIGISSDNNDLNVKYTASNSDLTTTFTFTDDNLSAEILFPRKDSTINFFAYYPYQASVSDNNYYSSDVSLQTNLGDIDFLIGTPTLSDRSQDDGKGDVAFNFAHALSMVYFNIGVAENIYDLNNLKVTLSNIVTVAKYNHQTGDLYDDDYTTGTISLDIIEGELTEDKVAEATATAIINPIAFSNATLTFTLSDGSQYATQLSLSPEVGKIHNYKLSLGNSGISFTANNTITDWTTSAQGDMGMLDEQTSSTSSDGSEANPFLVYTTTDLEKVGSGEEYTGGTWSDDAHYKLMADIDFGKNSVLTKWTPKVFNGSFDGNNHSIVNLYIDNQSTDYQGLFSQTTLSEGEVIIKNLRIIDCNITGRTNVGGIIGSAKNTQFSGCRVTGTVTGLVTGGNNYVGGITGYLENGSATNCFNESQLTSRSSYVGGIAGRSINSVIDDCYNTGKIQGYGSYIGGITGEIESISNCYNTGDLYGIYNYIGGIAGKADYITDCHNTGVVEGDTQFVGGIVGGFNYDNNLAYVESCYNTGRIAGTARAMGGIIGYASPSSSIKDCYNTGAVNGTININGGGQTTGIYYSVGGIVGSADSASVVNNCYNIGDVAGSLDSVGGIAGRAYYIYNCNNKGSVIGGKSYTGGVAGYASYVENCYNTNKVTGSATYFSYMGGVAGYADSISYCYNTAVIIAADGQSSSYLGGVAGQTTKISKSYNTGYIEGTYYYTGGVVAITNTISDCYNTGVVKGAYYYGGIVGGYISSPAYMTNSYNIGTVVSSNGQSGGALTGNTFTVSNCYYLKGCAGTNKGIYDTPSKTSSDSSYTSPKTETDLKDESFITTLNNGSETWQADTEPNSNKGYPILIWSINE